MFMEEKKLFLLDAYALIYRAYYALLRSPRVTSAGFNTSAIFGFLLALDDVMRKENPTHIAVCFDPPHGRTFRHEQYPEYKAGRDKQPEDITLAIPYIKALLEAYRIPALEAEGYEADDLIGTLSRRAEAEGFVTYMMTPDKDYGQLVTDRVFMYRPALKGQGFEIRGPQQVCERYGIQTPAQVIDLLALEGDASDNVPGCPGVGEKTAVKLIQQFGSVENMLGHTSEIKGALRAKIEDNIDQIRMSKELVTICTDAPVPFDPEALRRSEPDVNALLALFKELEFKSFAAKFTASADLAPEPAPAPSAPAPGTMGSLFDIPEEDLPTVKYEAPAAPVEELESPEEIGRFITAAIAAREVGIALNAEGAEAMTAQPYGIALAYDNEDGGRTAYIHFSSDATRRATQAELLAPLFADPAVTLVGEDIKRTMLVLRRMNVEFAGARWFDTGVAHYLCNPEAKHDTATLAMVYLGFHTYDADYSVAERKRPPLDAAAAMGETASVSLRLRAPLFAELSEKGHLKLFEEVETPMVAVLAGMEWCGARIDVAELKRLSGELGKRLAALEQEAYELAGRPFNVSSPLQVGTILFEEMQIDPKAKRTKGGAWSTAEDVLEKYANDVPLVRLILDIRALRKLLATYVDSLPKLINPRTGKLHTTYNQTATATGRLSSTNPNLQNIPIRTADGRDIRRAFVPDPGDIMLSADYSQIELRLMADMSGDPEMVGAFLSGADIHRATAAKIYHEDLADVTDDQRRKAKTANFGIIYGISAFGLSERLGIPRAEAKELIEGYLATYPKVAEYMQQSIEDARRDGFVSTIMGRKRYLPDIASRSAAVRGYAERNAINAPLQGSAADIIKVAMVAVDAEIRRRGLRSRMILQVHDELIFNVVPDELAEMQELVVRLMEGAYKGRVPMEVSAGVGANWLEAH